MNLSRPTKIAILVVTLLPLIYFGLFMVSFAFAAGGNDPIFANFEWFFGLHLGVMLLMFALLTFYVVFLFKTDRVKTEMKALWAIVLFFGWPIAMPIFWWLYIRPEEPPPGE